MRTAHTDILKEEQQRSYSNRKIFKDLWQYIRKYYAILIAALIFLVASTVVDLTIPTIMRYVIDNVINAAYKFEKVDDTFKSTPNGEYVLKHENDSYYMINDKTNEKIPVKDEFVKNVKTGALSEISKYSIIIITLFFFQFLFNYGQVIFSNLLGQKVIYDIREKLYIHMLHVPLDFFTKNPTGKITTRTVNDTQNLSQFFTDVLTSLTKDVAIIIGVIIVMFKMNVRLSLYVTIMFPAIILVTWIFGVLDKKIYVKARTRISATNSFLAENISGAAVTKAFNQEERKRKEFYDLSHKLYKARMQQIILNGLFRPFMNVMYYITISLLFWFGAGLFKQNLVSFGVLVAFTSYIDMFFRPLFDIAEKYDIMQNAFASAEKIFKLNELEEEDYGKGLKKEIDKASIKFHNVSFAYEKDNYILKNVSFEIEEHENIAIVGETGSGKTTIIKLINGLYRPQMGDIFIGNTKLEDYDIKALRRQIAVVPQDVFLFTGTILDNIRMFDESISEEEVINAAKQVHAHEMIEKFPDKYYTKILERGSTLSAGERQLIALARAVIFKSKIIILDEATANIDVETEYLIQKAMENLIGKVTILSIAHRLSTIKTANRILVVHKGRVVEEGTHNDLMEKRGIYYDLYRLQYETN
ncbi:ABC transporter ATP-binding protein [Marinitoga sp. 1135]|uniref:ABC-type multidrug transport system, ATPase and permease component n=1 Tax=Marinitoga piezophila (strain DSM 14283 / JCM 11233 / KA3) TaxID=443254 RepID=H2J6E8_MARPK|nr:MULTISPECIES: ABC transporter ATP-binding protein [Marinitoga]AEX86296.1 ABC-type multidrug transport system, ATPase and permease component [Marinitoga piezophila KA3]APT76701.1 ABC transporter ATP-binding protein [Marinitoga sp. 1137]NUU96478.1 ABC transporter ATP-binding protein [Marinitoga sp. 1135]NUU98398.1 ABC transporter ATP-binding protein [Marinitoga sp. 1138]